jgi:hypothetical protein
MTRPSTRLQPVAAGAGVELGEVTVSEYQKEAKIFKSPKEAEPLMERRIAFDLDETLGVPRIAENTIVGFHLRPGCIASLPIQPDRFELNGVNQCL